VITPRRDELGRFKLIASALAGRVVLVAPAKPGERPWTDGVTVFANVDASPRDQLRCVAVQAALLAAGSLDLEVVRGLSRRPALVRRYLAVEGHRALAAQEPLLPTAVRSLIDRTVAARSDSPAASLAIALGRDALADPPDIFGTIRPRHVRARVEPPVEERAVQQHVPRRQAVEVLRELDDGEDDAGVVADLVSSPAGGGGLIGRLLKTLLGDARSAWDGPLGADPPTHWSFRDAGAARTVVLTTANASKPDHVGLVEQRGTTYPEWDRYRRRYRRDWCTVVELEPKPEDLVPLVAPETHALRRPLARLGMERERRRRQLQGDDIDIDAAVEARVESLAGSPPDEGTYIESQRRRRDLAVLLLLDISGSSGKPSATGATVHEHQRAAAAALTVALHDLGDRVALYGFRSQGRSAVHVVPVKRFRDDLDTRVMSRLGALVPATYTRLGAAIRHGGFVLDRDGGTSRRLLVVLSDGFAYDHGYEGPYAEADARRALAETRRRGTGCLCLSIGADTDVHTLRRVFGTAAHAAIPGAEQLAGVVGPLFRSALRSAQLQRRAWQRKERTYERLVIERRTG
jgi:Mg-chelatase subunit ChlD